MRQKYILYQFYMMPSTNVDQLSRDIVEWQRKHLPSYHATLNTPSLGVVHRPYVSSCQDESTPCPKEGDTTLMALTPPNLFLKFLHWHIL